MKIFVLFLFLENLVVMIGRVKDNSVLNTLNHI
jgi:hypothetical protein